ncbi:helix-turn-helix domain-containing protein [Corynebacterium sp. NML130628]|uniref:helix-turn-helix domain-containing protein n=1 Tax=Corynebacterium sp. NML130628 TaxID=1906333 RepID=UPI0008FB6FBA|nr:helix-turn-helix transcriptional regulator [Corynebacterium sp. NML130628]OIR45488.1 transcriptional regulator [Corynebacterium sp. NML130628]
MTTTLLIDTPLESSFDAQDEVTFPFRKSEARQKEPLLREALGMSLRAFRADKGVTLRALAAQARVSSGYLSELERGRKEVSSELLASICEALDTTVSEVVLEAVANLSLQSINDEFVAAEAVHA